MDNVREALARGYCTERNKHKILDPDLIEDMAKDFRLYQEKCLGEVEGIIEQVLVEKIESIGGKDEAYSGYPDKLIKDLAQEIRNLFGGEA